MSMGINLINTDLINEYKLDKFGSSQWVIVVDKIVNCQRVRIVDILFKRKMF